MPRALPLVSALSLCLATACRKDVVRHENRHVEPSNIGTFLANASIVHNRIRISVQSNFDGWVLLESTPDSFVISWVGKKNSSTESIIGGDRFGSNVSKREQWIILPKRAGINVEWPFRYTITRDLPEGFPLNSLQDLMVSVNLTYISRSIIKQSQDEPKIETQTVPLTFIKAPDSLHEH